MNWEPLLSAVVGGIIALSGATLAEARRDRGQRDRDRALEHWRICVDFALALDLAHGSLREVARVPGSQADHRPAADHAVHESGVHGARERLLMSVSPELTAAGEQVFLRLVAVRNVVRTGASLESSAYHGAYHAFADALWRFRSAVRTEFGNRALTPRVLDGESWSGRESCLHCRESAGRSGTASVGDADAPSE
jgi:hypothetical protein